MKSLFNRSLRLGRNLGVGNVAHIGVKPVCKHSTLFLYLFHGAFCTKAQSCIDISDTPDLLSDCVTVV